MATSESSRVRLEVLGPVGLLVDGEAVAVSRTQVRSLLALFAAVGNDPQSADRLIEHVWGEDLPSDPSASLRVALSRLRSTLGSHADALVASNGRYTLHAASDLCDFDQLRERARFADPSESVALLERALDLWVGDEAFGEFGDRPMLADVQAQLLVARQTTRVAYAKALCENGRASEAVEMTLPMHRDDPGAEEITAVAARALAEVGRKTDALGVIEASRTFLREQLGLELSAALIELEVDLLTGAHELASTDAGETHASDDGPFVGRDDVLGRLIDGSASGVRAVVGQPGSGKSRLVAAYCNRLRGEGFVVHFARASATARQPMQVLTELMTSLAHSVLAAERSPELAASLLRVAPELADNDTDLAAPETREGLLARCREALVRHAPRGSAVLVIDDLQWIDRASAALLDEVLGAGACSVTFASRVEAPAHAQGLLSEVPATDHFDLAPLTVGDCVSYARQRLSYHDAETVGPALHQRCGGNPLFLRLLTDLLESGGATDEFPPNILIAVHERVSQLPPGSRRLVEAASIFPSVFDPQLALVLANAAPVDLDAALRSGLLHSRTEAEVGFAHTLVAEATYQLLSPGQRLDLHDEAALLLTEAGADAGEIAVHAGAAVSIDPTRAVEVHLAAAQEFAEGFDWELALTLARRAAEMAAEYRVDRSSLKAALEVAQGMALRAIGDPESDAHLILGVDFAIESSDWTTAATGLIGLCSHPRHGAADGKRLFGLIEQVLTSDISPQTRAQLGAAASTFLAFSPQQDRGSELFRQALALAESLGDRDTTVEVLLRVNLGAPGPSDFELRRHAAQLLRELAGSDPDCLWEAAFLEFGSGLVLNDDGLIVENLGIMRELTPTLRMRRRDFGLGFCELAYKKYQGDLDGADALIDTAVGTARDFYSDSWAIMSLAGLLAGVREAQGRVHEMLPFIDGTDIDGAEHCVRAVGAAGAAHMGDKDRAARELAYFYERDFVLPQDATCTAVLSLLVEPVELLEDRVAAAKLLALAEPLAGRMLWNGLVTHRSADETIARYQGVLA